MDNQKRQLNPEEKAKITIGNLQEYTLNDEAYVAFEKLKQECEKEAKQERFNKTERDGNTQLTLNTQITSSDYQQFVTNSNQKRDESFIKRYEEKSEEVLKNHDPSAYEKYQDDKAELYAFNHGYLAEKYDHEVARMFDINKSGALKEYQKSFSEGRGQRLREKDIETLEKFKEVKKDMNLEPQKNKDKKKGRDFDKD